MEKEELLIKELSELTGAEIELSPDKTCDLTVEDRIVVMRYRPEDDDWLYFCIVVEPEGGPSKEMLAKALELNLFGAETLGLHLGLFGDALILSGSAAMDGLTAEAFAEKLLFLSRQMERLAEKLSAEEVEAAQDSGEVSSPWDSGFMQV
jgi:hypothetical protein